VQAIPADCPSRLHRLCHRHRFLYLLYGVNPIADYPKVCEEGRFLIVLQPLTYILWLDRLDELAEVIRKPDGTGSELETDVPPVIRIKISMIQ
jgi:hypothetical protein